MKISEQWLREWVNPEINTQELSHQLTMLGLEVDSIHPVAGDFSKVIVGEIESVEKHPDASKLNLCQVNTGSETLQIICGASNVRPNLKVPLAMVDGHVGEMKIKAAKLRGILSNGMICSAKELGLAEASDGILELPDSAPVGEEIKNYLNLLDNTIEIELTPNRGDCLSILGTAREIAVKNNLEINTKKTKPITSTIETIFPINIHNKNSCPYYIGRVIKNIDNTAQTPIWLQEKLRRCGLRAINPVVDITNFVMLELGQPMHGFDLATLDSEIIVRDAEPNEKLILLDGQEINLQPDTLLITDKSKPLAIAGVMGGLDSGVTDGTKHIFLESAFFTPEYIAGKARQYGLSTDSSHRFERGVDPELAIKAIERASELILEIMGGEPGPVITAGEKPNRSHKITLRHSQVTKILGIDINQNTITQILNQLNMACELNNNSWTVTSPSYRFDIQSEIDLIEEVGRIVGYDEIPNELPQFSPAQLASQSKLPLANLKNYLINQGYFEAITYSFIDEKLSKLVSINKNPQKLKNPISPELSVMREFLWPGLFKAAVHNLNRQQSRVRLFESGLCFQENQVPMLAGLVIGDVYPEQWGEKSLRTDFFDVKKDVENLFGFSNNRGNIHFVPSEYPGLHPNQQANIMLNDQIIGFMGAVHPKVCQSYGLDLTPIIFEIRQDALQNHRVTPYEPVSKYPSIRRDLSFLVDKACFSSKISDLVREVAGKTLQSVQVFDVYQGQGVAEGQKSLAISLTLQDPSRTLIDNEVAEIIDNVVSALKQAFGITLRD